MNYKNTLARFAYSWLWRLLTPFYILKLWRRGRKEPEYWQNKKERFGFYSQASQPLHVGEYVWIHAVSLGESRASATLIDALRAQMPDVKLLLTHGTATGRQQGKLLLGKDDVQCWLPLDVPEAIERFFNHFKPRLGILIETEIWPNLMHIAKQAKVPMFLVNARLSEKSLKKALKAQTLLKPAYQALSVAFAQSNDDARRLQELGVNKVEILGNIKYDMLPPQALVEQGQSWKTSTPRKVMMAASTREGEEAFLLQAWKQAVHDDKPTTAEKPILLIVPRHPQRFEEVEKLIATAGLTASLRSQWGEAGPDSAALQADIWLGDSLREMTLYYALSDLVLVGGSFLPFGGQGLIEALSCGMPIIFGEHTYNFSSASELALQAKVGFRVENFEQALVQAMQWLKNSDDLKQLQENSRNFIKEHQGASDRTAIYIIKMLNIPREIK